MGKIITVYGGSGSGKSTLSVNLAEMLSQSNKIVCIVNADINCGTLQVFFGEVVPPEKSILAALSDKAAVPEKYLHQVSKNHNIYLLSIPNETYDVKPPILERESTETLLRKLSMIADYLIVDCTSDVVNGITLLALRLADYLCLCHKSAIESCLWYKSHQGTIKQLSGAPIFHIISEHDLGCGLEEYCDAADISGYNVMPYIENAAFLKAQGIRISNCQGRRNELYRHNLNYIVKTLECGEV